jgi:hypothetical protein
MSSFPTSLRLKSTLSILVLSSLGFGGAGCDMIGAQVRVAAGMPPVTKANVTVVNNGIIQICKMHVADESEPYLESYSLISTQYEYLGPGAKHQFEVMLDGKPKKIRLSACDGTVLKELHDVALVDGGSFQVMAP